MKYKVLFRSLKNNQFYVHSSGMGYAWVAHTTMKVGDTGEHVFTQNPPKHTFIPNSIDVEVLEINSRTPSKEILPYEAPRPLSTTPTP
jgi:hypothetical protein